MQNCRSYCGTSVEVDHMQVCAKLVLRFGVRKRESTHRNWLNLTWWKNSLDPCLKHSFLNCRNVSRFIGLNWGNQFMKLAWQFAALLCNSRNPGVRSARIVCWNQGEMPLRRVEMLEKIDSVGSKEKLATWPWTFVDWACQVDRSSAGSWKQSLAISMKKCQGGFSGHLKESVGSLKTSIDRQIKRWMEYFESHFGRLSLAAPATQVTICSLTLLCAHGIAGRSEGFNSEP